MDKNKPYCRYLRGKNAFGTLEGGEHPFLEADTGTTTYWCIRTMSPVGPDDRLAHLSTCGNPDRKCFKQPEKEEKQ